MKRYSRQSELVYGLIRSVDCHPTGEWVYEQAREQLPAISLGTVYRLLSHFTAEGKLLCLTPGDGTRHFDANVSPHDHFFCTACGALSDLPGKLGEEAEQSLSQSDFTGVVEGHQLTFYGLCPRCREHRNLQ